MVLFYLLIPFILFSTELEYQIKDKTFEILVEKNSIQKSSLNDKELLITFESPLPSLELQKLQKDGSGWIKGALQGFDTLLIRLKSHITADVDTKKMRIALHYTPTAKVDRGEVRLEVARARLDIEDGNAKKAQERYQKLLETHPKHPDVIEGMANAELQLGRWQRALSFLNEAYERNPNRVDLKQRHSAILQNYGPYIRMGHEVRSEKDSSTENISTLISRFSIKKMEKKELIASITLQNNLLKARSVRNHEGILSGFNKERLRCEVQTGLFYETGDILSSSLFLGHKKVGAALKYEHWDSKGAMHYILEYQRPLWNFIGSTVNLGTRDRIAITREQRFNIRSNAELSFGWHHYRAKGGSVGSTIQVDGRYNYETKLKKPKLSISYTLDGEYGVDIERKEILGIGYNVLGFSSREVHSLDLLSSLNLTKESYLAIYGGYSFNRLGSSAPRIGSSFSLFHKSGLEFLVEVDHSFSAASGSKTVDRLGAYIKWNF